MSKFKVGQKVRVTDKYALESEDGICPGDEGVVVFEPGWCTAWYYEVNLSSYEGALIAEDELEDASS